MWICPNCENEIDSLDYSVDTRESGYVSLYNREGECDTDSYESQDSEWQGSVDYHCPECNEQVDLDDLTLSQEEEEEEETKKETKEELEEEKFNIIKPEISLQTEKNNIDQTENTMICKHCFYVFVYSTEKYGNSEEFLDCPNCGEQNSEKEYKKLIADRFFEKIKIKRLRRKAKGVKKKYAKKTNGRRIRPMG